MTLLKSHMPYVTIQSKPNQYSTIMFLIFVFFFLNLCTLFFNSLELGRFLALELIYKLQMHAILTWIHIQICRIHTMAATMLARLASLETTISRS